MFQAANRRQRGFSLIELVIVVVIIGIIGAIAIPRMSRGSQGATESSLVASLAVLRNAIDLYHAEHDKFPTVANFGQQMSQYSDYAGTGFATAKDTATGKIFGPYLRAIPPAPIGPAKGQNGVAAAAAAGIAWIYDDTDGTIILNSGGATDDAGNDFNTY